MANGDVLYITSWDPQDSYMVDWWDEYDLSGGSWSYDTGQSVPDGSSACLKILHNDFFWTLVESNLRTDLTYMTTGCVSFWFKGTTDLTAGSNEDIISIYRSANTARNARIFFDTAGALRVGFWKTNQVSSNLTTIDSGWHYIQLAWDYSTTTNKLKLAVDGVQFAEQTYTASAAPGLDYIRLGNWDASTASENSTSTKYYGPIVVTEGYYIPLQKFKVTTLRPTSDVNSNWTVVGGAGSRWASLDDSPEDLTKYIESSTSGQEQQMGFADVTLNTGELIKAVAVTSTNVAGVGTTIAGTTIYLRSSGGTDLTAATDCGSVTTGTHDVGAPLLTKPGGGSWTASDLNGCTLKVVKEADTDTVRIGEIIVKVAIALPITKTLTGALSFSGSRTISKMKKTVTGALSFTSAQTRIAGAIIDKALTAALSFTGTFTKMTVYRRALTGTLSFTGSTAEHMWRQLQDAGGWFIKKGRIRRRRPY